MRVIACAILIASLMGCASKPTFVERPMPPTAALAFTPPIVLHDEQSIDLRRDGREPSAYVGYDQQTVSYLWVRTDDRIGDGTWYNPTRFQRRAVSTTVSQRVR
jgi:hypothetical protein